MEFKHIVRIANTDLDGNKQTLHALRKVKGVSFVFANAVLHLTKIPKDQQIGTLSDADVERLARAVKNPLEIGMPIWLINRRKDPEEGTDKHLVATDLTYARDNDIKMMQKMKSYRGYRHAHHQPVRGQRTKSHFRANKGKVQGVKRAKAGSKKT
ncbi:30S ribosomal protein S13 [Candidatus Woesearchaeota archaeon]|nr:30S ribosomal protein S13 [Candidatus Woesearchaeota archaeon]